MFDANEMDYCRSLVATRGNSSVGHAPSVVASYLRLQAASAFRAGDYESAARLGHAATQISWSADNAHRPDWDEAARAVQGASLRWRQTTRVISGTRHATEAERAAWRKEHGE